jgi:hypothetical protein
MYLPIILNMKLIKDKKAIFNELYSLKNLLKIKVKFNKRISVKNYYGIVERVIYSNLKVNALLHLSVTCFIYIISVKILMSFVYNLLIQNYS